MRRLQHKRPLIFKLRIPDRFYLFGESKIIFGDRIFTFWKPFETVNVPEAVKAEK